jgi:hypothetical protein
MNEKSGDEGETAFQGAGKSDSMIPANWYGRHLWRPYSLFQEELHRTSPPASTVKD